MVDSLNRDSDLRPSGSTGFHRPWETAGGVESTASFDDHSPNINVEYKRKLSTLVQYWIYMDL